MFSSCEQNSLDFSYFIPKSINSDEICIRSKNSRHFWKLISIDNHQNAKVRIEHAHKARDSYHFQENAATIASAIKKIKKHDIFVMKTQHHMHWLK